MIRPAPIEELAPDAIADRLSRLNWYDDSLKESFDTLRRVTLGILLAGALFPITFVLLAAVALAVFGDSSNGTSAAELLHLTRFAISIGAVLGLLGASAGSVVASVLIPVFNWCFQFGIKARHQVAAAGGLAGFVATGWVFFDRFQFGTNEDIAWTFGSVILAMLMAQIIVLWYARHKFVWDGAKSRNTTGRRHQFRLRDLFVLMAIVAVVGLVERLTSVRFLVALFFYAGFQSMLLVMDVCWVRWRKLSPHRAVRPGGQRSALDFF